MGQFSENKLDTITKQLMEDTRVSLDLNYEDMQNLFLALKVIMKAGQLNPVTIMRSNLGSITLEDSTRFHLTMTQSLDTGVTGVTIAADAMAQFPRLRVWKMLKEECQHQLNAWHKACTIVARDGFIAYTEGPNKEFVRSTLFPDVFYAAKEVLLKIGGEKNIRGIMTAGKPRKKVLIDKCIKADMEDMQADIDFDDYKWGKNVSILDLTDSMEFLLGSVVQ